MKAMMEALEGDGVQENIITKNCQVELELERMKVLLARVGGRISLLPDRGDGRGDGGEITRLEDVDEVQRAKVARLLDSL